MNIQSIMIKEMVTIIRYGSLIQIIRQIILFCLFCFCNYLYRRKNSQFVRKKNIFSYELAILLKENSHIVCHQHIVCPKI